MVDDQKFTMTKCSGELSVLTAVKTFYPDFQNFILTNVKKYQYISKNKERKKST